MFKTEVSALEKYTHEISHSPRDQKNVNSTLTSATCSVIISSAYIKCTQLIPSTSWNPEKWDGCSLKNRRKKCTQEEPVRNAHSGKIHCVPQLLVF